jgi:penicillin-binding protein 2
MMVSQGGFGASTSGLGVRNIYETLFGYKGGKIDQAASLFPSGKPPVKLPKISPATRPAGEERK